MSHAGSQLPDRGQPVGGECLPTGLLKFFDHLLDPGRHQLHLLLQFGQIVRRTYFDASNLVLQTVCRILQVDANLRHRAMESMGDSHPVEDAHGRPRQEQRHQGEVEHGSRATPLGRRAGDKKLFDLQQALTGGGDFVGQACSLQCRWAFRLWIGRLPVQAAVDALSVLRELRANGGYEGAFVGRHGRAFCLGQMCVKRGFPFRYFALRVPIGQLGHFEHGSLQTPQDILHGLAGLNCRQILRQLSCVAVVQPIHIADGRTAHEHPQ